MPLLYTYLLTYNLDMITTMNTLQLAGLVSDNAVTALDVADADFEKAKRYMERND